jgi:hypothetical protein
MALAITVNGGGTFTASMEEGPVSFTASLAAVGPAGPGVAAGGAEGQILVKASATDYDTEWIDNSARSEFVTARNNTGTEIGIGKVVYLSGATGNKATMALAQADSEATSARTIGITKAAVPNNQDGDVIISGEITGLDTSAFNAGDVLYLSETTAGGLRVGLPTQPNHGVVIGIVTRSHPSLGSIEVTIQNYQELEELSDVLISSETNLDLLSWDSASSVWKNKSFATLGLLTSASAASTYQTIAGMSSYLAKADNLSGLANLATSRTNLGLGTTDTVSFGEVRIPSPDNHAKLDVYMWRPFSAAHGDSGIEYRGDKIKFADASEQTSAYVGGDLKAASNLSDLASASTARTNLDVYSKSESDGLVPDASTTAKGKVELATDAEAVAGTSSTLAVTPAALRAMVTYPGLTAITTYSLTAATSGTGALSLRQGTSNGWVVRGPTSAVGYAVGKAGLLNSRRGGEFTSRLDWSKPCVITARCTLNPNGTIDANSIFRMSVGKITTDNAGDIASGDGVQIKVAGGGAIQLLVCASSTVTTVTSSFTPTSDESFDVAIHSDGSGNVALYVNGSSVATTTGGPILSNAAAYNNCWHIEVENINTLTDSFAAYAVNNAYIHSEG